MMNVMIENLTVFLTRTAFIFSKEIWGFFLAIPVIKKKKNQNGDQLLEINGWAHSLQ